MIFKIISILKCLTLTYYSFLMEIFSFLTIVDAVISVFYGYGLGFFMMGFFYPNSIKKKKLCFFLSTIFLTCGAYVDMYPSYFIYKVLGFSFSFSKVLFLMDLALWAQFGLGVLFVFTLIVIVRVATPRAKLETLGRLGWGPLLALLLSLIIILLISYFSF